MPGCAAGGEGGRDWIEIIFVWGRAGQWRQDAAFTGTLTLLQDTINGNFADNGGGIFWAGTANSAVNVQNTIIAGNAASTTGPDANNAAGTFTDNGGNLIGISGAGSGNTGFTAGTTQTGTVATMLRNFAAYAAALAGFTAAIIASDELGIRLHIGRAPI